MPGLEIPSETLNCPATSHWAYRMLLPPSNSQSCPWTRLSFPSSQCAFSGRTLRWTCHLPPLKPPRLFAMKILLLVNNLHVVANKVDVSISKIIKKVKKKYEKLGWNHSATQLNSSLHIYIHSTLLTVIQELSYIENPFSFYFLFFFFF